MTGERRFRLKTDLVAIAFDLFTGEVHQHGNPTRIQSWAATTAAACALLVPWPRPTIWWWYSGPLPVDELNKCLAFAATAAACSSAWPSLPHGKLQR